MAVSGDAEEEADDEDAVIDGVGGEEGSGVKADTHGWWRGAPTDHGRSHSVLPRQLMARPWSRKSGGLDGGSPAWGRGSSSLIWPLFDVAVAESGKECFRQWYNGYQPF
ncbi:serine/threonine-protein kinase STY46 [Canna indica]|uniref:Serine/threonine-protein kinase STY46 n=1 Tax=Canna indica TaxID=4628 RepID=A0AAQ3Q6D3_9LILI|nr:serine/threonine-protein kinase STY46 [Canna indica]